MSPEQLASLTETMLTEARAAFSVALEKHQNESLYGFALYTDDSAAGVDIALNSTEAYEARVANTRTNPSDAYWHTIEWQHEGGFADLFDRTTRLIESGVPEYNDEAAYDRFRREVFDTMVKVMDQLVVQGVFAQVCDPAESVVQVDITDSEDSEHYSAASIKALNPATVYDRFTKDCG